MRKALTGWFVICLIALVAVIALASGCNTTREQRVTAYKKAFVLAANAAVIAYQSGGKDLAAAEIDKKVAAGDITAAQGEQLKAAINKGVDAIKAAADKASEDTAADAPAPGTAGSDQTSYIDRHDSCLMCCVSATYRYRTVQCEKDFARKLFTSKELGIISLC